MYFIFFSPVFIEQDLVHSQKYIYNKQKWEISFYCCFYVLIILFPRNLGILRLSLYLVKCSRFYKRMQWNSANCLKYFPFRSTFGFVSLQSLVFCVVFSWSLFVLQSFFFSSGHGFVCPSSRYGFWLPVSWLYACIVFISCKLTDFDILWHRFSLCRKLGGQSITHLLLRFLTIITMRNCMFIFLI